MRGRILLWSLRFAFCCFELFLACTFDVGAMPASMFCHRAPFILALVYATTVNLSKSVAGQRSGLAAIAIIKVVYDSLHLHPWVG